MSSETSLGKLEAYLNENVDYFRGFGNHPTQIVNKVLNKTIGMNLGRFVGLYIGLADGDMGSKKFQDRESLYNHIESALHKNGVPSINGRMFSVMLVEALEKEGIHNYGQGSRYSVESRDGFVFYECGNTEHLL